MLTDFPDLLSVLKAPLRNKAVLLAILLLVVHALSIFNWYVDDAFISQCYARTFATEGKFAYSPGDAPHFGISNPLWVFMLTPAHIVGVNAYLLEKLMCLLFGVLSILLCGATIRFFSPKMVAEFPVSEAFPGLILGSSWNYAAWMVGGLETAAFGFLILLAAFLFAWGVVTGRNLLGAGVVAALLAWLRPEGIGITLLIGGAGGTALFAVRRKLGIRPFLVFLIASSTVVALFLAVMQGLTGATVPATYYIKAGHLDWSTYKKGISYALLSLKQSYYLFYVICILGPFFVLVKRGEKQTPLRVISFILLAVVLGYVFGFILSVGGDWMLGSRFFVHLFPSMAVLAAVSLFDCLGRARKQWARGITLAILISLPLTLLFGEIRPLDTRNNMDTGYFLKKVLFEPPTPRPSYPEASYRLVDRIRDLRTQYPRMAMTEAGFFPYYCENRYFDLHGWSPRHLTMIRYEKRVWASDPFQAAVLDEEPDLLLFAGYSSATNSPVRWRLPIEKALYENPRFQQEYTLDSVWRDIDELYRYPREKPDGPLLSYYLFRRNVKSPSSASEEAGN